MPATILNQPAVVDPGISAQQRILSCLGEPLFHSDWLRAVFIHYEVDPELLQRATPFPLDLRDGKAYVSLVAFTMHGLRPRLGGRLGALLFAPIATHDLLNVRTYVRHNDEPGIQFLTEWIPNRLSTLIGPLTFGLPYRHGRLQYEHLPQNGVLRGTVTAKASRLNYAAHMDPHHLLALCPNGSLDEFLLERYTAFTCHGPLRRFFRVWHPPWMQTQLDLQVLDDSLLVANFPWFCNARLVGANYSPGVEDVWMGRPHFVKRSN